MVRRLRDNFKEEMNDTLRKIQESNPPLPAPAVPPPVNPPQLLQVLPPVSPPPSVHTALFTHRRSRSQPRAREHLREDADLHFDKRPHSQHRSPLRANALLPSVPDGATVASHDHHGLPGFDYVLEPGLRHQPLRTLYKINITTTTPIGLHNTSPAIKTGPMHHSPDLLVMIRTGHRPRSPVGRRTSPMIGPLLIITIKNRTNSMVGNTTQPPDGVSPTNPTIRINPPYIPTKSASKRHNLLPNLSQLTLLIHLSMPTTC